jgi:hypothetical protein
MSTRAPSLRGEMVSPALMAGELYRIAYGVGAAGDRRITRSVAVFTGATERKRWDGVVARCLEFALPRGRVLTLLEEQLVDARPALINEHGQLQLVSGAGRRRRRILHRRR